jgi:uncharacterized protein YndB with AHSA1/START domain
MYGTLEHLADGRWQLQFMRTLPHSPEKVWRAITEPEHLEHWFPTTIEGERADGAKLRFAHRDGLIDPFDGEMLAYEPQSAIEFRWGTDIIRIELRPEGQGTVLTLLDTLDERGKAARDAAGWHVCLDGLADHLRGAPDARESTGAWRAVHPGYVERLGPEAATVGPPEGFE